jgi:hypothetical protein
MTARKKIFRVALCSLAIGLLWFGYSLFHLVHTVIPHSYVAWSSGNLLVEYMETHDRKWPHNWNDLREVEKTKKTIIFYPVDILEKNAKIDWSFDPATWKGDPIWIVTQLDGSRLEARWGPDTEPNRKVQDYLLSKKTGQTK